MNLQERIAWFNLAVMALALAVFLVLIPFLGLFRATGGFGILGLWGLSPLLAWRKRGTREVIDDERDRAINAKAMLIAYTAFWMFFVSACMVPFFLFGPQGMIPVEVLPLILMVGWLVLMLTSSVATIVQYARGRQNAHG
jgi:uncharacterized Tic20 family protein